MDARASGHSTLLLQYLPLQYSTHRVSTRTCLCCTYEYNTYEYASHRIINLRFRLPYARDLQTVQCTASSFFSSPATLTLLEREREGGRGAGDGLGESKMQAHKRSGYMSGTSTVRYLPPYVADLHPLASIMHEYAHHCTQYTAVLSHCAGHNMSNECLLNVVTPISRS